MNRIRLFYHICLINHWPDVLHDQLSTLIASGLYNEMFEMNVGVLGDEHSIADLRKLFRPHPKIQIVFESQDLKLYEFPTLKYLSNNIQSDDRIFYWHCKGVSYPAGHKSHESVQDRRRYMEYFLVRRYRDCLYFLNSYDCIGVDYLELLTTRLMFMFSGNFWWTTGRYVMTLPEPRLITNYIDAELWLCLGHPKKKILWNSNTNQYTDRYTPDQYVR